MAYNQRPPIDPEIEKVLLKIQQVFQKFFKNATFIDLGVLFLWLATGFFVIQPNEEGVVTVLGKYSRTNSPGWGWNFPVPIGRTFKVPVTTVQKTEIGFRTVAVGPPARYQRINNEALMLTGDENIVSLEFIVQYRIKNALNYLFAVRDAKGTLKVAAESAMREVVGMTTIDYALTDGKSDIQLRAQEILQNHLDTYNAGIQVVTVKLQDVYPPDQVSDAFKDVISAQQDRERKINEAQGFRNNIIPSARGEAAEMVNRAEAFKEAKVTEAQGETARFKAFLREYQRGKNVTKARLYLETMEEILPSMDITIIDQGLAKGSLPHFNIASPKP